MTSLLPPNSTPLERALEGASQRLDAVPVPIDTLWSAGRCPAPLLPWLAWSLSVDTWEADWPETVKRAVIAASFRVHQRKGTVASVREALAAAGFGAVEIIERLHRRRHDGATSYNGHAFHGDGARWRRYDGEATHDGSGAHGDGPKWATYRVVLRDKPITNAQAAQVRRLLASVAPARSHLLSLDYAAVANTYGGTSRYDGTYNHGAA